LTNRHTRISNAVFF